jgi:AcrR family transcriptional regulator
MALALLDAAEAIVQERGPAALSVRAVAGRAGAATRAVHCVYDSKEGPLVALGGRAFDPLGAGVATLQAANLRLWK